MDAPDPTVYYYTYSTLAQTLAGAFGFLAAIVLYRLQAINGQLRELAAKMMTTSLGEETEPYRTLLIHQHWPRFLRQLKTDADPAHPNPAFKKLTFLEVGSMEHFSEQMTMIRHWFYACMFSTVLVIALCLTALAATPWFQHTGVLTLLVGLGILVLATYGRLMVVLLRG